MATLYFNGAVDSDWNKIGNWWTSDTFATQASALPTSIDDVVLSATCYTNSGSEPTVVNLTYNSGFLGIAITVTGDATFNDSSFNYFVTVYGNATFNDSSINFGTVSGDATFNDSSVNCGTVNGDATLNDSSSNYGTVNGDATFNDSSRNHGTVYGNATFNDSSFNNYNGTVTGDATFNGDRMSYNASYNNGTVSGNATFNDNSYNDYDYGTVNGDATLNDSAYNYGTVTGDATFNDSANNDNGTVSGNATFNDNSYNNGIVNNDAIFNDSSYNDYEVSNDATFNGSSYNTGTVTNDATFNNSSFNDTGGVVSNDAIFNGSTFNNGTVTNDATFNDGGSQGGTVSGNATFNGVASANRNTVSGNAIFNDSSFNDYNNGYGIVAGNATFNDSSYNAGTVSSNATWSAATFTNFSLGTVSGTITFSNASPVVFTTNGGNIWQYISTSWTFTTAGPTWIFNDVNTANGGYLQGDATFNDVSNNTGTVSGNATFNYYSYNNGGTITGNATFNGGSNNQTGTVSGNGTFNDTSHNDATISTNATFNGSSYNAGTVSSNATWSAATFTNLYIGNVSGTKTFSSATPVVFTTNGGNSWAYDSSNWYIFTLGATWIFDGTSTNNAGRLIGDATFNNTSYNSGTVETNATFNSSSYNNGTVSGSATFNGSSSNQGVVGSLTTFNDNSGCTAAATFNGNITVNYPVPVPLNSNGSFGSINSLGYGVGITYVGYSTSYLSWNAATNAPVDTWTHIALVRINGICRLYADGVTVLNFSNNVDLGASHIVTIGTGAHNLGENFPGYIDEVRISSSGIYNGDFSPPTSPLTDDSSLLLLHFDGNMTDSSSHSLTVGGTATTTSAESKFGGSSINTSSSYAEIGSNALFGFGTGDFTIEMWIYPTSVSAVGGLINIGTYDNGILIRHGSATDALYMSGSRTLYFNNGYGMNGEWNDQKNWFFDTNYSYLPSFIPTSVDNVIANNNISTNSAGQPTIKNFSATSCTELQINLTVTGMATFTCASPNVAITVGTTLTGNATFNGYASPAGTVTGSGIFNGTTHNDGTVGYGVFNDTSSNGLNGGLGAGYIGYVTNNAVFNDSSTNGGGQGGSKGIVSGNAIFNDSSVNNCYYDLNDVGATPETGDGFVHGSATFKGQSKNKKGVGGSVILAYDKGINGSNILGIF